MEYKYPKQTDDKYRQTNIAILKQVMGLLYETHVTGIETAKTRGLAIRSVQSMIDDFGGDNEIAKAEQIPFSQRRRESKIWGKLFKGIF